MAELDRSMRKSLAWNENGVAVQAARLIAEGHTIEPARGEKPPRVKDWEKALA